MTQATLPQVQRYSPVKLKCGDDYEVNMIAKDDGQWMRWEAYRRLLERLEQLQAQTEGGG